MGQNLSLSEPFADTSGVVLSPSDRANDVLLAAIWGASLYGIGMIWCAVGLLRRWAGPNNDRGVTLLSILAALLMSSGWPVILAYFAFSNNR